jgi:hypothetical protein
MGAPPTLELAGSEWTLGLLSSTEGLDVGLRLMRVVGQGAADALSKSGSAAEMLIASALSRAEPQETLALIKRLLARCLMDGKPLFVEGKPKEGIWEMAFQGRLLLVFRLAAWAVKENAGDFSDVFGSPPDAGPETASDGTSSTSARTGSSPGQP